MSDSKDDSGQNVKDKPFTKKVAYTETTRGKGARALLIFFVIAGIIMSIPAIMYQLANPSLGYIDNANAQQVASSNGKIYLRTSGGTYGYQVYDNATRTEIGTRAKPSENEYYKIYAKDNLVYGWTQASSTLWVDYWGGTGSTPVSTSISFGTNNTNCVASEGNYAYVGLGNGSIAIVNTTLAPASVSLVNVTQSAGFGSTQIVISGDFVYGCSGKTGGSHAAVVNVSNSDLQPQGVFGSIDYCSILGSYAYTYSDTNLSIHDLSSPMAPLLVKTHPISTLGTPANGFLVYHIGTQKLALILAGAKIWVFDVTDPNTPTTLGYFNGSGNMGMSNFAEDESCIYATVQTLGIWILAKDKLGGLFLTPPSSGTNLLQILTIAFYSITIFIPVIIAVFFWKRERRIAESKREEFWVKSSTVTRTGIILALTIVPILFMLQLGMGLLLQWYVTLAVCAIWALILFALPRISLRRQRKRKQKMSSGTDQRMRLLGMIKAEKKLNMRTASEMTGMSEARVKTLIYDLVGEGKLEGDFQGDTFVITSDVNEFIKGLENSFATWEEQAKTGEDKKV